MRTLKLLLHIISEILTQKNFFNEVKKHFDVRTWTFIELTGKFKCIENRRIFYNMFIILIQVLFNLQLNTSVIRL